MSDVSVNLNIGNYLEGVVVLGKHLLLFIKSTSCNYHIMFKSSNVKVGILRDGILSLQNRCGDDFSFNSQM